MKQKEIMKKPIISFGVKKAIKLGFLNNNLYDFKNNQIIESSKKKINDYQYHVHKNYEPPNSDCLQRVFE